jgi:hypothetical protein
VAAHAAGKRAFFRTVPPPAIRRHADGHTDGHADGRTATPRFLPYT